MSADSTVSVERIKQRAGTEEYCNESQELFSLPEGFGASTESQGVLLRPLRLNDYNKGFLQTLAQLTKVGEIDPELFSARFKAMAAAGNYFVVVAEEAGKIVGTATLVVELKFIHAAAKLGHIEDVVVLDSMRGKNIGKRLVDTLLALATAKSCYKVVLDCSQKNTTFYEKCGMNAAGMQMVVYLNRVD